VRQHARPESISKHGSLTVARRARARRVRVPHPPTWPFTLSVSTTDRVLATAKSRRIARREPHTPSNSLKTQKLKLAERVGFAPLLGVENKELKAFSLPRDPLDPLELR